jgi:SlyX protein
VTAPVMSNQADAESLAALQERVENLEIKASFAEDLLEQLNLTIYRQQEMMERLTAEVVQLRRQVPEGGGAAARNLRDELPPHY